MRIHAVSTSTPLLRTLAATLADAEVTASDDVAGVPTDLPPDATVLLDAETTAAAFEDVSELRLRAVEARVVIIGDVLPQVVPDEAVHLLVRPVPFAELRAALDPAGRPPARRATPVAEPASKPVDVDIRPVPKWRDRFAGRRTVPAGDQPTLEERLERGVPVLDDLLLALEEYPELADRTVTAQALVDALLVALPRATTTALLLTGGDSHLRVIAYHGLTVAERLLRVPFRHPLLADLRHRGAGRLLVRTEGAELLRGVPGARAPVSMAVNIATEQRWHGVVIIGAASFETRDLATANAVARECATAVVVASYLHELAAHGVADAGDAPQAVG
jgi:hypothetical protein